MSTGASGWLLRKPQADSSTRLLARMTQVVVVFSGRSMSLTEDVAGAMVLSWVVFVIADMRILTNNYSCVRSQIRLRFRSLLFGAGPTR